jgi:hypothetical protein
VMEGGSIWKGREMKEREREREREREEKTT